MSAFPTEWERWDALQALANRPGHLYGGGQTAARRQRGWPICIDNATFSEYGIAIDPRQPSPMKPTRSSLARQIAGFGGIKMMRGSYRMFVVRSP